jgi:hypothetical protein
VQKRAGELRRLVKFREAAASALRKARTAAQKITATYATLIKRTRRALNAIRGKSRFSRMRRGKYRADLANFRERRAEWADKLSQVDESARSSQLDVREVRQELAGVLGTTAEVQAPGLAELPGDIAEAQALARLTEGEDDDTAADASAIAYWRGILTQAQAAGNRDQVIAAANELSGLGVGQADAAGSTAATTQSVAEAASAMLAQFNEARATLYGGAGFNFARAGAASNAVDPTVAGAGARSYGAGTGGILAGVGTTDVVGASGGGDTIRGATVNVTNVFPTPPPDPHTWARGIGYELTAL